MNIVILLLAGKSERFNKEEFKQFIKVKDKLLFEYSLDTFNTHKDVDGILLVTLCDKIDYVKDVIKDKYEKVIDVIAGGSERQSSILNAINYLKEKNIHGDDNLLIHDSARPLISEEVISNCLCGLKEFDSVIPVVKVYDTVSIVKDNKVNNLLDRQYMYVHQTPQCFKFNLIYKAHQDAVNNKMYDKTDDVSLIMNEGKEVHVVEGSPFNFKITTPMDLAHFASLLD